MIKLTGGIHRSRPIRWLDTPSIRPTPARVREAVFNILGDDMVSASCWDLCCGSGIMGLEALSRGAAEVVFVDHNRRSLDQIKANLRLLSLPGRTVYSELLRFVRQQPALPEFIYCDPPYESGLYQPLLEALSTVPCRLSTLVLEHRSRNQPWENTGNFIVRDQRRYGDSSIAILTRGEP